MSGKGSAYRLWSVTVLLLTLGQGDGSVAQQPGTSRSVPAGQSATLLADGRWLLIGGEKSETAVAVLDPSTGRTATLATRLDTPRAWHTATVLPDGGILIAGGVDAGGNLVSTIERFDLGTQTFQTLSAAGLLARSRHTATLLTDGRVLFTGGVNREGRSLDSADLWDAALGGSPVSSFLGVARSGHSATLLADGRVMLASGRDGNGRDTRSAEVFDPQSQAFQRLLTSTPEPGEQVPALIAALPAPGDADVDVSARITLRFSPPLDVRSIGPDTLQLTTDGQAVSAFVVPAESGRLAFVTPAEPLRPSTQYTLTVHGPIDTHGRRIRPYELTFMTAAAPGDVGVADDEDWMPEGNGWRTNRPSSPWQSLRPLQAEAGITALAGQVLRLNGAPLAGVTLEIAGRTTESDRTGRFLLAVPGLSDGFHKLVIEGDSASRPGRLYGRFEARVTLNAGHTTVLPFAIWMTRIDTAHTIPIPSPTGQETVVTTPLIPGLELRLPPNTVIHDHDGEVVRELTITPIPLDRPPFPLPEYFEPPVYFTIQPGGAYVYTYGPGPRGARLIYPNSHNYPADSEIEFWHYDPEDKGWFVYGTGRVQPNLKQVAPNPGVAIYEFNGAMINGEWVAAIWKAILRGLRGSDPVDLGTGLFVMEKTDLYLPDIIPLALTRTYRQGDSQSRPFGIGSTHPFAIFLWSAQQYQEADLIMPDGARVHYVRTSSGTSFTDAAFEHTATPTAFYKSVITWNGNGWDLRRKDGMVYVFGNEAPLQSIRDRYGNTVTLTWSHTNFYGAGYRNILKVTASASGRFIEFTYDGSNRITSAIDNSGRTVGYEYDGSGRLWKVTDPNDGVTEYTYDSSHRMLTIEDARGIVYLTNEYDSNGRVTLQTQADDTTFDLAYTLDGSGNVTQTDLTNPRGYIDRWSFNSSGYPTSHIQAVGTALARTTTSDRLSGSSLIERITDGLDREIAYTYDSFGNVTSITRLDGTEDEVTTSITYEATHNQVASITDSLSHTTSFTYDSLGHLTSITNPLGHTTTLTYNGRGLPLTITNPLNKTTTFAYHGADLTSITDPLGRITTRFVDLVGRLLRVSNALGQATQYEFDVLNRVTKIIDALGGETEFTYDPNNNLLTLTDARNNTTTYTYDEMDRISTRTDPLDREESYSYDANGNLDEVTDRKAQVTAYTYDALDRMTLVTYDDASTTAYTYDAGDRLTEVDDSVAGVITREWDGLDRLIEEDTPEGLVNYTYDDANRRATMTVDGQTAVSYSYDNADRLTGITQGTASVGFAYDNSSRRTTLTLPNGIQVAYGYDDAGQVTGITYTLGMTTLGTLTYGYDLTGNRITVGGTWARTNLPAALASATYDDGNQISTWGATSFTYDANGHLTNDGAITYSWNARDQLTGLSGGASASFAYDGLNRRRSRTVSGTSRSFLYDDLNLVQELAGGTPTANLLTGLGIDDTYLRTISGGTEAIIPDVLGSTVALANGSGAVQTQYTYEPFGAASVSGTASSSSVQFTGRENDGTGLMYYRSRYYSPPLQRFTSEDPIGFAGGINVFAYVENSPTSFVDPLGLDRKANTRFGGSGGGDSAGRGAGGAGRGSGGRGSGSKGGKGSGSKGSDSKGKDKDSGKCDGWFNGDDHTNIMGRDGTWVDPRSATANWFEDHILLLHAFSTNHDGVVEDLTRIGVRDSIANIPTMLPTYMGTGLAMALGYQVCHP